MASKKKDSATEQPTLPGFDLAQLEKETRTNTIKEEFDSDMTLGLLGRSSSKTVDNPLARRDRRMTVRRPDGRAVRRPGPTEEVVTLLRNTDIPLEHFRQGSTTITATNPSSYFSRLSRGTGGSTDSVNNDIFYDSRLSAAQKRGVVTHELAHSLQHDAPLSVHSREVHKTIVKRAREAANTKDSLGGSSTSQGPIVFARDASAIRERGRKELARYAHNDSGDMDELQSVSVLDAGTPISEGSAEGYREKYQGRLGHFVSGYSAGYFSSVAGPDAGTAYETAHRYTNTTGRVVTNSDIMEATRLAGVLKSDLHPSTGKRQHDVDSATTHRMMQHLLEKRMGVENPAHAEEYETRIKAIEGEVVQPPLSPDWGEEVNQFGKAPTGTPERSLRGEALASGRPTEIPASSTVSAEYDRQQIKIAERKKLQRGMDKDRRTGELTFPYESKHRTALRQAVRDKQVADEKKAKQETVSSLHPKIQEYVDKLVYDKKKEYALAYAKSLSTGGELPALPKGLKPEHAENVRKRVDSIHKTIR